MLTVAAFNALLKILEEPPSHVKFIFATTEPNKVLATIQSRCQRYDFRNISAGDIADHLKSLLKQEKVAFEDDLVLSVAKMANGSMRDGLSLLDRLISTGATPLSTSLLEEFLGQPNIERIYDLIQVIGQHDAGAALTQIDALVRNGLSEAQIVDALIDALRDLMVISTAGMQPDLVILTQQQAEKAEALARQFDAAALIYMVTALEKLRWTVKNSDTPRTLLEASVLRFALSDHFINIDTLLKNLSSGQAPMGAPKKKRPLVDNAPAHTQTPVAPPAQPPHTPPSQPSQPPAAQTPPASQAGDIQRLRTQWKGLLDSLTDTLGPGTTTLLAKAQPAHWKNGTLTLEFGPDAKVQKGMCENSTRADTIKHALQERLNAQFHLVFTLQEAIASPDAAAEPAKITPEAIRQKRNELLNDPGVKTVLVGLNATVTNIEEKKEPE
jgi:DNA polymerase-3 subunit gamma/tau